MSRKAKENEYLQWQISPSHHALVPKTLFTSLVDEGLQSVPIPDLPEFADLIAERIAEANILESIEHNLPDGAFWSLLNSLRIAGLVGLHHEEHSFHHQLVLMPSEEDLWPPKV